MRPSSAHRWIGGGCTASVMASEGIIGRETEAAREGTRLHDLAARVLLNGDTHHEPEDWEKIGPYVLDVEAAAKQSGNRIFIEHRVAGHGMRGTLDAMVGATIWDLKTGYRPVEAENNWQLLTYAILAGMTSVTLKIVQHDRIRSWVVEDLAPYRAKLLAAIHMVQTAPRFVASSNNCTYCPAMLTCPAARTAALGAVDLAYQTPLEIPPEEMRQELRLLRHAAAQLNAQVDVLEEEIRARIVKGGSVPGCALRPGRASALKWRENDVKHIRSWLGPKVLKPEALLTPKQAIKAGFDEDQIHKLSERPPPKQVLDLDYLDTVFK